VSDLGEVLFEEVLGSLQAVFEPGVILSPVLEVPGVHDPAMGILGPIQVGIEFAVLGVVGGNGIGMALQYFGREVRLAEFLLRRRELGPDRAISLPQGLPRLPEGGHRRCEVCAAGVGLPGLFRDAAELFELLGE
jgi:hypothetical protein